MADDIRLVLSVDDRDLLRARKEQEKYQFRLAQIEKEYRKGNITAARYNKELAKQASELAKLGGGYNKANSEIRKYAFSLRSATDDQLNLAQAMAKSGKGMRRMEILAQQAGYQIGDLAVQIQSGTNAAVALGQQGSQLLGFFGPTGAIAGAALAIGTGLIAPLLKSKDTTRDLSEELEELEESLNKVATGAEASISAGLTASLIAAQTEVNRLVALTQSEDFQRAMGYAAGTAEGTVAAGAIEQAVEAAEELVETKDKELSKANILEAQERVRKALIGDQVQEAQNLADAKRIVLNLEDKNKVAAEKLEKLEQGRADAIKAQFNALMASIAANDKLNKQAEERQKSIDSTARGRLIVLQQQNAVIEEQLKYGIDSERVETLRNAHTVANLKASLEKQGVDQSIVDVLVDQQNELLINKGILQDQVEEAEKLEQKLKDAGKAFAASQAKTFKADVFDPRGEEGLTATEAMRRGVQVFEYDKDLDKDKPQRQKDLVEELRKQLEVEQALIGKTEARQRLIQALGVDYMKYGEDTINNLERQITKTIMLENAERDRQRALEEARQKQEELANDIAGSMGDAFLSIVDGTKSVKDAFQDMARYIIRRLYEILVVEQMVQSISGAIGGAMAGPVQGPPAPSANGNIFSNGSIVPFANGGIIGSPMLFPMAGGRTGLMGEAGPEAIMPLKRGKNGKLGVASEGGGNVTVNQTFAFQANGDESVKKIIAQQAPKIAQMTTQQIMDSRRRGGQMKAVFG
jgi:phage-related minor tail protein